MGIPGFFSWLQVNYGKCVKRAEGKLEENSYGVVFDLNALLHETCESYFKIGTPDEERMAREYMTDKDEHIVNYTGELTKKMSDLIDKFGSPKLLIVCVDGVPSLSKIMEQRRRRYNAEYKEGYFNKSLQLTAGTDFMSRLGERLKIWCQTMRNKGKDVVYSGHEEPGEGEHKMFKILKNIKSQNGYIHIIGDDNDLILLGGKNSYHKIKIYKLDFFKKPFLVDTFRFRNELFLNLTWDESHSPISLMRDFTLIAGNLGNDFIPSLATVGHLKEYAGELIEAYKFLSKRLVRENGEIIWENYFDFLSILERKESSLLKTRSELDYQRPIAGMLESRKNDYDVDEFEKVYYPRYYPIVRVYPKSIDDIIKSYLNMVQWYMFYYEGEYYGDYYFPYIYGPTIQSLLRNRNKINLEKIPSRMNNVLQHLFVFPPKAVSLTPYEEVRNQLMESRDYPLSFPNVKYSYDGVIKDREPKIILPPFDESFWIDKFGK